MAPLLADERELLAPDFLGFGASDKPVDHVYSVHEQADLIEALWQRERVSSTSLLAHDYGVSVAQELLARARRRSARGGARGRGAAQRRPVPELHRAQPTQTALRDPDQGPQVSAMITEELFIAGLGPTFAEGFDAAADSEDIWRSMNRDRGERILHLLIHYMYDREVHGERWRNALEQTDVPLSFVWGMLDPVSGAHMAERIRERLPDAPFTALERVAHWPPLEAPQEVARAARN